MRYHIAFRRLALDIDAEDEQAARDFAKYRWGIPDANVQFIEVRPVTTIPADDAPKGWDSVPGGTDQYDDEPPAAA